jgi:hypothetical protein
MHDIQKRLVVLLLALGAMIPTAVLASRSSTRADENRKVVVAFYERFFNQHDLGAADCYIGDVYIQHNPNVPNGREAFVEGFTRVFCTIPAAPQSDRTHDHGRGSCGAACALDQVSRGSRRCGSRYLPAGSWSHRGTLGCAAGHPGAGSQQQHHVLIQASATVGQVTCRSRAICLLWIME